MVRASAHKRWVMPGAVAAVVAVGGCSAGALHSQPTAARTGATLATTATGAGATASSEAAAGTSGCSAITRADLVSVGLRPDLTQPSVSPAQGSQGAYCTYTKASGADGGIEFDWFRDDATPAQTWQTVLAQATYPAGIQPTGLAGVTDSMFSPGAVSGGPQFADITVRRGDLIFDISAPPGSDAKRQLTLLARIVLRRTR